MTDFKKFFDYILDEKVLDEQIIFWTQADEGVTTRTHILRPHFLSF